MAELTIYKADGYARQDKSTETQVLDHEPVDVGVIILPPGIALRFLLPKRKAVWWGELALSLAHAEQLKIEIDSLLDEFKARRVVKND